MKLIREEPLLQSLQLPARAKAGKKPDQQPARQVQTEAGDTHVPLSLFQFRGLSNVKVKPCLRVNPFFGQFCPKHMPARPNPRPYHPTASRTPERRSYSRRTIEESIRARERISVRKLLLSQTSGKPHDRQQGDQQSRSPACSALMKGSTHRRACIPSKLKNKARVAGTEWFTPWQSID